MKAQELKEGASVSEDFLVIKITDHVTKNGKPFQRFVASDETGEIPAIFFESSTSSILYSEGAVWHVNGIVESYQGKLQLKVQSIGMPERGGDKKAFIKSSQYDVDAMWDKLIGYVFSIEDASIKSVSEDLFCHQGYADRFKVSPAATGMHHAFQSGLLEHTVQMAECADVLLKLPFFQALSRDLCLFGILFHDFGKIFEYESEAGFKRTVQGVLVPHIPMMGALIFETANKLGLPELTRDYLMHMVLSHHMNLEWGSPVVPACPEAAFVHYVDNLHGTVFGWLQKRETKKNEALIEIWGSRGKQTLLGKAFEETKG